MTHDPIQAGGMARFGNLDCSGGAPPNFRRPWGHAHPGDELALPLARYWFAAEMAAPVGGEGLVEIGRALEAFTSIWKTRLERVMHYGDAALRHEGQALDEHLNAAARRLLADPSRPPMNFGEAFDQVERCSRDRELTRRLHAFEKAAWLRIDHDATRNPLENLDRWYRGTGGAAQRLMEAEGRSWRSRVAGEIVRELRAYRHEIAEAYAPPGDYAPLLAEFDAFDAALLALVNAPDDRSGDLAAATALALGRLTRRLSTPPANVASQSRAVDDADERGYVAHPSDPAAYVPVSDVVNNYCADLSEKELIQFIENPQNGVTWTRPLSKDGTPRKNRRNVHLTKLLAARERRASSAEHDPSPEVIAQRVQALRSLR